MAESIIEIEDVGFGYSPFPHELSRDPSISMQAKGLFAIYGSFVSKNNPLPYPSESHLRNICGQINAKTLRKYKRELIKSGWISQEQPYKNGRLTTLLIKRYASPALNPNFVKKSTDVQKTDGRKIASRNLDEKQERVLTIKKTHTQCASSCARKKASVPITSEQSEAIEAIFKIARDRGEIRNEGAYRRSLEKLAREGKLDCVEGKDEPPVVHGGPPEWLKDLTIRGTRFNPRALP